MKLDVSFFTLRYWSPRCDIEPVESVTYCTFKRSSVQKKSWLKHILRSWICAKRPVRLPKFHIEADHIKLSECQRKKCKSHQWYKRNKLVYHPFILNQCWVLNHHYHMICRLNWRSLTTTFSFSEVLLSLFSNNQIVFIELQYKEAEWWQNISLGIQTIWKCEIIWNLDILKISILKSETQQSLI